MRIAVIILAVAVAVMGVMYFQADQTRTEQAESLRLTQEQLDTAKRQTTTAELEVKSVREQMLTRVAEMQQSLTTLGGEKEKVEARAKELQSRIEVVEKELADEKTKLTAVEDERTQIAGKLTTVKQQLVDLQKKHTATEAELAALQQQRAALESERDSLERRLNDLDELRAQIRVVKRRIWEQHIADWKKRDAEIGLTGNAGMLLKHGQWQK